MINESGPQNKAAFAFISKAFFLILGLHIVYFFFRGYLYQHLVFANGSFSFYQLIQMVYWGLRFDLCVSGFLLIPIFTLFILSLVKSSKWNPRWCHYIGYCYLAVIYIITFAVYYFNLPFILKNAGFGIPYWMRLEDYKSMYDFSIYPSYWHFDYVSEVQGYHTLLIILFSVLVSLVVLPTPSIKIKGTVLSIVLYFIFITLMARGKLGEHHIRFEDSKFSSNKILNELSLNPLWLIDKPKEQLSQY